MAPPAAFGGDRPPAPVAPEHVKRLLLDMSLEGEFITITDLAAFVARHSLPFSEELLASMFAEANSSENGLVDAEQLGKAASFKFPYRRHNDDWARLFELAPRPGGPTTRITALSPHALEQEPVRANFEQEPNILTFRPVTNAGSPGESGIGAFDHGASGFLQPLGTAGGLSQASFSTAPRTLSSSAVFNTAHSVPTRAGGQPDTVAERDEEDKINRRMRPASWYTKGADGDGASQFGNTGAATSGVAPSAGAPHLAAPAQHHAHHPSQPHSHLSRPQHDDSAYRDGSTAQVASFEHVAAEPMHCGFDACEAFDRSLEGLQRVSAGVGWKTAGAARARAQLQAVPQPLLHGLHERDWLYLPGGPADHISLRVDGCVGRITGEPATTSLRLLITENSQHSLANSRKHALHEDAARFSDQPFVSRFAKSNNEGLRKTAAEDRLEVAKGTEFPPAIAYLNGRPTAHEFRAAKPIPEKQPLGEKTPKFITDTLGRHWPLAEGKPASVLLQANPPLSCPPMRLMYTENEHPAARSTRIDVRR